MKKKIETKALQQGMYVSELDRPWLETPFLFQGFVIRSDEEMRALRDCCSYVYIDDDKGLDANGSAAHFGTVKEVDKVPPPAQHHLPVEEEMAAARQVRQKAEEQLSSLLEGARLGKGLDVEQARYVVGDMVESLIRNPDALMLLSYLTRHEKEAEAHAITSSILALTLGRYLKLPHNEVTDLGLAALLHDIGQTAIPLKLLQNGPQNEAEEQHLRQHTRLGALLLKKVEGMPQAVVAAALHHHEQVDGNGYPGHLKGDAISMAGKVVAIINVYDRITNASDGPHLPPSEALRYLYLYRGKQFDLKLTEAFIKCLGIYPVGSIVELAYGAVGIVISIPPEDHLHPRILLVRDRHQQPLTPPKIMSLGGFVAKDAEKYAIVHVHPNGSFGIDVNSYLSDTSLL